MKKLKHEYVAGRGGWGLTQIFLIASHPAKTVDCKFEDRERRDSIFRKDDLQD